MICGKSIGILAEMSEKGLVSATDVHLAEFLVSLERNLSENEKTFFAAVTALVSNGVAGGKICLVEKDISEFAEKNAELMKYLPGFSFEKVAEIFGKSSCCTGKPEEEFRPLVSLKNGIYFYKYWLYESSLAAKMAEISKENGRYSGSSDEMEKIFNKLFDAENSEQHEAAKTAVKNRFSVITGGPGTGKTTIIAKILIGIATLFPQDRVMLAAPTGKAAARMTDALKNAVSGIRRISDAARSEILDGIGALEGMTIHRMLDWKFGRFSQNRENPLAADVVIIDEAGMLDVALFNSLLDALGHDASLILLGDKDQLASVGAGNVLSDICGAAEKNLLPPEIVAKLEKSYRFNSSSGIGKLAKAVNEQKSAKEIIEICKTESDCGWFGIENEKALENIAFDAAGRYGFLFDKDSSPEEILERLNDYKVLVPSKEDSFGVTELNRKIESELGRNSENGLYDGMPIMVTKNDYRNNLMNGDCGVILERNGRKSAYFIVGNSLKSFNISSLVSFETVYAMTIHKSQGSEYDSVLIVLPKTEMPILTKEILYTAVTRAKKEVKIAAKDGVLDYTLRRNAERNSGFEEALNS
ncbi:exodeoxyribonuclease V subunit alpha [bacterium]|nr:exodeoxyribonuclease V subunit alpha [bacterium]